MCSYNVQFPALNIKISPTIAVSHSNNLRELELSWDMQANSVIKAAAHCRKCTLNSNISLEKAPHFAAY